MAKRKRRKGTSPRQSMRRSGVRRRSSNPISMGKRAINSLLPRGFKL